MWNFLGVCMVPGCSHNGYCSARDCIELWRHTRIPIASFGHEHGLGLDVPRIPRGTIEQYT